MVQVYFCLDWSSLGGISRHPLLGIGQFRILVSAATLWQKRAGRGWWLPPLPPNSGMILDSGGFSVLKAGANEYPFPVEDYLMVAERYRPTYVCRAGLPLRAVHRLDAGRGARTLDANAQILEAELPGGTRPLPVIQGWTLDQYIGCVDSMRERGLLTDYLGVGSVCVRKRVREAMGIARALREALPARTRLHYFGLKIEALRQPGFAQLAESIDTGAWALYGKFYAAWGGDGLCEYCGKERTYEAGTRGDVGHLHRFPRSDQRLDRFYRYVRVLAETPQTALERFGEAR